MITERDSELAQVIFSSLQVALKAYDIKNESEVESISKDTAQWLVGSAYLSGFRLAAEILNVNDGEVLATHLERAVDLVAKELGLEVKNVR